MLINTMAKVINDKEKNMKNIRFSLIQKWKDKIKEKINKIRKASSEKTQSDEMMRLAEKLRLHKSKVHLRTVLLWALVFFLIVGTVVFFQTRVLHHYKVLSSVERSDDSATRYVRLKGRTLKCNPNGVTCVNDSNDVLWNVTFTMQSPIADVCGSTAVVGDCRGKDVYVFNRDGQVGHFEVEHTLLKVKVASQGVVAAVLEDGEITWTNVYDSQGAVIVKNKTSMAESGYPLDIDISANGQKMAVSYLTLDDNNIKTKVAFYNFSSAGKSESDYLVNSEEYSGTTVPRVTFLDNHYAVAFRDNGLTFFSGKQVPEKKTEVSVECEIISAIYNDKFIGIITANDNEKQDHKYKMQIYRSSGSRSGTYYFDFEYTDVALYDDEIVMYNDNGMVIYDTSGRKIASVEYEKRVLDVIKTGKFNKYEIITPDSTDRIKLK